MGVPLKVACSEVAIAFGDAAATYLSAGFRLFCFDGGGAVLARVAARVVRLVVLGFCLSPRLRRDLRYTAASC
jgi:hypothetical protein